MAHYEELLVILNHLLIQKKVLNMLRNYIRTNLHMNFAMYEKGVVYVEEGLSR